MPRSNVTEADRALGMRIRERRRALGLRQTDLARRMDVTYQAVYKWEAGLSGLSRTRLGQLSDVLKMPVGQLVENLQQASNGQDASHLSSTESTAFMEALGRIESHQIRRDLLRMIQTIADECASGQET